VATLERVVASLGAADARQLLVQTWHCESVGGMMAVDGTCRRRSPRDVYLWLVATMATPEQAAQIWPALDALPAEAPAVATFDALPDELLLRMARMLLRDDPQAAARLLGASRVLRQLAIGESAEAAELRAARALTTHQRLTELRVPAGREEEGDVPVLQQLLPPLDTVPEVAWQPPEPVTLVSLHDFTSWRVTDGEALRRAAARVLRVSGSIARLSLGSKWVSGPTPPPPLRYVCCIGDEGAKALAAGVAASRSLVTLDLCHNRIGDEGAKALVAGVAASGSLAELDLSYNQIGDEGAKAIAEALLSNGSLVTLSLAINDIGDEGAKAIAEALLSRGSWAEHLNLSGNLISSAGANAISEALLSNCSLALKPWWVGSCVWGCDRACDRGGSDDSSEDDL